MRDEVDIRNLSDAVIDSYARHEIEEGGIYREGYTPSLCYQEAVRRGLAPSQEEILTG
ncbi:MAG: hypothetical protein FWG15_07630 [Propionibacteriaceae bacterium]|nr:hypothetical protein [Propionibacteriaceae bacterium]